METADDARPGTHPNQNCKRIMTITNESIPNLDASSRPYTGSRPPTLGEQTAKVADDVRELGSMAIAGTGEALKTVKEHGSEVVGKVRERGQEALEKGRERATQAREGFEAYAAENLFKTMLIAAGIGALIGYRLGNRN